MIQYYMVIKTMFWRVLNDNENIHDILFSENRLDENLHVFKLSFVCVCMCSISLIFLSVYFSVLEMFNNEYIYINLIIHK